MPEIIEIGKISSRGQISIPSEIRDQMGLEEGNKIIFLLSEDNLLIKKVSVESFAEITKPLRESKKKIEESEVNALIHKIRIKK